MILTLKDQHGSTYYFTVEDVSAVIVQRPTPDQRAFDFTTVYLKSGQQFQVFSSDVNDLIRAFLNTGA